MEVDGHDVEQKFSYWREENWPKICLFHQKPSLIQ